MKWSKKFKKEVIKLSAAALCFVMMGGTQVFASSNCELVGGIEKYKGEQVWDEEDDAPILRVELKDAYQLKGKQEVFTLELNNAEWAERKNTTLYISRAEGINVYDGYVYTATNNRAEVTINIPQNIKEDETIIIEIPLFIKIGDGIEEASVSVREKDEDEGIIDNTEILIATTSEKKMNWSVGEVPTVSDEAVIAPIRFEETSAGILGSREIQFYIYLKNEDIKFDEPQYLSKTVNKDDTDYILDIDEYIEYSGGFSKQNQLLKVAISNDGKSMRVQMSGSVPTQRGIIILKNLPVISAVEDAVKQDIKVSLRSDDLMANDREVVVAHYVPKKAEEKEEVVEGVTEETEEKSQESAAMQKTNIVFQVGKAGYSIDGQAYHTDGAAYIKEPGYTMVPVRYVAEALGIQDIKVKNKVVSFNYEDKKIEMTIGSTQATVNQEVIVLPVPLEVKNGRIYAPIGEVAMLLGLDKTWDAQTKSACFTKIN